MLTLRYGFAVDNPEQGALTALTLLCGFVKLSEESAKEGRTAEGGEHGKGFQEASAQRDSPPHHDRLVTQLLVESHVTSTLSSRQVHKRQVGGPIADQAGQRLGFDNVPVGSAAMNRSRRLYGHSPECKLHRAERLLVSSEDF